MSFPQFSRLNDELVINVLSYVADVPYRDLHTAHSTLTHDLPLVSKVFYSICRNNDYLWALSMERLVDEDNGSDQWFNAMKEFIYQQSRPSQVNSIDVSLCNACRLMQEFITENNIQTRFEIHGELYRYLLSNHIRYCAPVFYMPDEGIQLAHPFSLHFFEPRYRRLIAEVMAPYPQSFRNGGNTTPPDGITPPPTFIYGNRSPFKRGNLALIVRVMQCVIKRDGTADVCLCPLEHVRVEAIWEQEGMHDHLYFARVMKIGQEEQREIEISDGMRRFPSLIGNNARMAQAYLNEVLQALDRRGP